MSIRNKDGSIFKLRGPNPVMNKQSFWDEDSQVHNFDPPEFVSNQDDIPLQNIPTEEVHVTVKEIEPTKLQNPTKKVVPKEVQRINVNVLMMKIVEDNLYGQHKMRYDDKPITTELVLVTRDDLNFVVWTNAIEIPKYSIIYVPEDRRWWKVQNSVVRSEGWLMQCVPSDLQPSF